jgi:hypothetical protein
MPTQTKARITVTASIILRTQVTLRRSPNRLRLFQDRFIGLTEWFRAVAADSEREAIMRI